MSPAFIPQAVRSLRSLSPARFSHCALTRRPAPIVSSPWVPRPRMQCTPSGEVPEMNETIVQKMENKISTAVKPSRLQVVPTLGDPNGAHVSIEVVSSSFEGMSSVKRHQIVYKAIWEELQGPVHAVDKLVTKTPAEDTS